MFQLSAQRAPQKLITRHSGAFRHVLLHSCISGTIPDHLGCFWKNQNSSKNVAFALPASCVSFTILGVSLNWFFQDRLGANGNDTKAAIAICHQT
jgi:hypothetical protein